MASSSQQLDDLFDGAVGFVVGGLEFRQWWGGLGWVVAEEAVSKRTADALVEKHKEQGDAGALVSKAIGVAATVSLQQSVGFEFAQFVTQLGKSVAGGREAEAGKDGLMDLGGAPSRTLVPACSNTSMRRSIRVS